MNIRVPVLGLIAGAGLLLLPGCDGGTTPPPSSVTFNGVTYNALGQATLRLAGATLVVENIGTTGPDGVHVDVADDALDSLGVLIQPLTIGSAAVWGVAVFGDVAGQEEELAAAWVEDIGAGRNAIQVSFASGLGLDQVFFEYFLAGVLVSRSPPVPTDNLSSSTVASAGTTNVGPHSVHAVREGGVVVIGTDYRADGLDGGGAPGVGCLAALIQVSFQTEPVCADYVRAVPLSATGTPMPAAYSAEVGGRGVGRFVITDGAVE